MNYVNLNNHNNNNHNNHDNHKIQNKHMDYNRDKKKSNFVGLQNLFPLKEAQFKLISLNCLWNKASQHHTTHLRLIDGFSNVWLIIGNIQTD